MNSKQKARRKYLIKKGFIPEPAINLKRTENNIRYEYPTGLAVPFQKWSSQQWNVGKTPLFKEFYEQLAEEQKKEIIITNV